MINSAIARLTAVKRVEAATWPEQIYVRKDLPGRGIPAQSVLLFQSVNGNIGKYANAHGSNTGSLPFYLKDLNTLRKNGFIEYADN